MKCASCSKELEKVFENDDSNYQYDNALWLGFYGGYGMFVESEEFAEETIVEEAKNSVEEDEKEETYEKILPYASYEAVICHECAHKLCEEKPWLNKLLKPETGHAHKVDYWKNNPDHVGWDNPNNKK